jgi:hypothetical protein
MPGGVQGGTKSHAKAGRAAFVNTLGSRSLRVRLAMALPAGLPGDFRGHYQSDVVAMVVNGRKQGVL